MKVKIFLGCLLGYDCIQCLPGVADMSKRKLKAASGSYGRSEHPALFFF
jgi:hypothetical protein